MHFCALPMVVLCAVLAAIKVCFCYVHDMVKWHMVFAYYTRKCLLTWLQVGTGASEGNKSGAEPAATGPEGGEAAPQISIEDASANPLPAPGTFLSWILSCHLIGLKRKEFGFWLNNVKLLIVELIIAMLDQRSHRRDADWQNKSAHVHHVMSTMIEPSWFNRVQF